MASLKDTVISGSLRVTDTIFSTNLNLSSLTASYAVLTDANKNLISRAITDNTSATAVTASTNLITANTLYYHKGNSNIVTVGTITSGTWSATTINPNKGGTGVNSYAKGDILYAGDAIANTATTALSKLALGTAGYTLQATANGPAWAQTVAVANGGTGATSAAGARKNLSVPAISLSTSYPKLMPINSSGTAVDDWIMIGSTTTYGILPGASGGAGSGHCYIGTSSWYWANAYIDQIYGYLNGSCSGNAASATKVGVAAIWMYPNNSNEVNFGGTYTGNAYIYFGYRATDSRAIPSRFYFGSTGTAEVYAGKVHNAVWNDYAEYRKVNINEPGRVVVPSKTGTATKSTMRLQAGGRIISDTFGCSVGKSNEAKTPLGMAGRVLAYPYRPIEEYQIGDCVCTAPNGTVDIMTREEIKEYPDRIIGIVNEIPTYEIWEQKLTNDDPIKSDTLVQSVKVNGRIWIDIK